MLKDSIVVRLSFLWNTVDHALTHLQKIIKLQSFTLSDVWIMISGLHHQKKIEILITFSIIIQSIVSL